ncbi:hypothetical protein KZC52_07085 [Microbacterium sp. kSW2-24]|uniref:ABC transporter substrate-binding protein n=1 Tax=Microbacterium galbinum TaxID=2851646 RepID=UPI001FFD603E|nr:ABC transporter substrate-binding protein [Microbacterium galbinum]MCK2022681.1 hypothetical protein [Microbacterium galbinum]
MRITAPIRAAVAVTTVAVLVLAGCASTSTTDRSPDADQTLRIHVQAPPANWSIGQWSGGDATMFLSVYDTIIGADLNGNLVPAIAESWEYDDTRTQLTLHIRDDMTFTDDTPVDAPAVAASLDASRAGTSTADNLAAISNVEAVDESTVIVSLSAPDAALLGRLAGNPGAVGATEVLTAESSQLTPVGSGPYTLDVDATTVGATYVLERNDDNWNAGAYPFETVEVSVIQDPTAVQNAVQASQLDYAGVPSVDIVKQFSAADFTSGNNSPNSLGVLWIADHEGAIIPALADVRVRKAINLAIDRDSIAQAINQGANNPTAQYVNPNGPVYDETLNDLYAYDLAAAKELMTEAGYADGFEVTMPSTVVSVTYESVITQSLADIGITVTWETVPFQDFYAKVFGGSYAMFFMFNGFSVDAASDMDATLEGVFNPFRSSTPELDELLSAARASSEEDADANYSAVNAYLVEEAWNVPITYITGFYVASNDIKYTSPAVIGQSLLPYKPADSK